MGLDRIGKCYNRVTKVYYTNVVINISRGVCKYLKRNIFIYKENYTQ